MNVRDFLTSPTAWYVGWATTDEAYDEAEHLLESCPEVEAVIIWAASHKDDVEVPDKWAVLFAADLVWPTNLLLTRKGYDPMPKMRGDA